MAIIGARAEEGRVTPHLLVRGGRKAIDMTQSIYGIHPGVAMVQTAIAKLPEKTGRSLEEWVAFIRKSGPAGEAARRAWLKKEQKLGTNYASWLADLSEGKGENGDPDEYLEAAEGYVRDLFGGSKEPL